MSALLETLGSEDWRAHNAQRLERAAQRLIATVGARAAGAADTFDGDVDTPLALAELARRFSLTAFERDLILLCAVHARSAAFAQSLQRWPAFAGAPAIDFRIAASLLRAPVRLSLSPSGALRRWRLIELGASASLERASISLDERVQFYLEAHSFLDPRLTGLLRPLATAPTQHGAIAGALARSLRQRPSPGACPIIEITGGSTAERQALVAAVCAELALAPHLLDAGDLPSAPADREALARLWERESMLQEGALLIDADGLATEGVARLRSFLQAVEALVFLSGALPRPAPARGLFNCELPARQLQADVERWRTALGPLAQRLNGSVERTVWQFTLDDQALANAAAVARASPAEGAAAALWNAARVQSRRGLESLAPRIETRAGWHDLVLPAPQIEILRSVAVHLRERQRVYREWGFADQNNRGLGIAALFAGSSGTGKTLAAEVLANELSLDLHKIDLARIVSKYIGETEKNLARVFEAAEASGAILLFDEADALFGKRSEVRDSHDRYANIEVSYLLQRIESYRGLSILTTNLKQSIDGAFLRRLRFVVQFPFPDDGARRDIWNRVFPEAMPRESLDLAKLARLNLAGGHIRNIALNAAFLAADRGEPLRMHHLRNAAESEYAKLERPLPRADVGDWT